MYKDTESDREKMEDDIDKMIDAGTGLPASLEKRIVDVADYIEKLFKAKDKKIEEQDNEIYK